MENKIHQKDELRSAAVQDILTDMPHWIIRWGNCVILLILIMFFTASYFIRYPEIISAPIVITTNNPPQKLVAKLSGKIEAILVKDNAKVKTNTPLAIIENSANYKDVFKLKSIVDSIDILKQNFPFEKTEILQLGEIENSFAIFQKEYIANELNFKLKPYKVEGNAQKIEGREIIERISILEGQRLLRQNELELQKSDLDRHEKLYSKGIIALQEFEKHKLSYLQGQREYQSLLSNLSQLKSSLNDLNKNSQTTIIEETKEGTILQKNMIQAFFQLKKDIREWELNYVFQSASRGMVSYLKIWKENQTVVAGESVFSVIPDVNEGFIGKVKAPLRNSGKLRIGQKVFIKLINYPDIEFGVVEGKILKIASLPDNEGNLLIDIALPHGLKTSFNADIKFQQEMSGVADIITEDLRLCSRILYQFRNFFKR